MDKSNVPWQFSFPITKKSTNFETKSEKQLIQQSNGITQLKYSDISAKVSNLSKTNQKLLTTLNEKIKKMNEEQKKKFDAGNKEDTLKVAQLNQKANDAIKEFRELQEKFTNGMKDNVRRQAIILKGDISEDEVEDMIMHP